MTIQDPSRYTIQVSEVAEILKVHRDTVHNLAEKGELSYVLKPRGQQEWKHFDPDEVRALALKRNGEEVKP